ncbi:hypothetical protein [Methanosphaera cuniculi]|uniref:hypothetical protein n=1 Tax=Methanosphaera cuniculi TaxID=1077256 RepID=UPI0026DC820C|nr:hypothetical protein [Methanosphaera cuniculi]
MKEHIWEYRYPRESTKSFNYFTTYVNLGEGRSLAQVREKHKNNISLRQLKDYSRKYKWVKRAEAKDEYDIQKRIKEHEKEKEEYFKKRLDRIKKYHDATDAILQTLLIDLGLTENPKTGKYEKKEYIQSTSVANSLKNLSDANVNNTKLALRFLGLPETIRDVQEISMDSKNTITADVNVQKTLEDQQFMEEELKFMKKLVDQQ